MRKFVPILVVLANLQGADRVSAADNWPQFRGPNGDGIADTKSLPTKWSDSQNVRWKVAIHDKGWSSPVVWGNQVWVTTARSDGKQLFAVCVDRVSGKVVHDLLLFKVTSPQFCHPFNSFASPTPVIEEGRLYAHFGSPGTVCVDTATGKVLWSRDDLPCNHHRGAGSSPIVYQNLLVLTFDGYDRQYVAALDKTTGKTVWQKDRGIKYTTADGDYKKAYSTPSVLTVHGKPQLVSPSAEATIAYDPLTGTELWRVSHGGMNQSIRPVLAHGLIYLNSGHTSTLLAVLAGGTGDVTETGVAWKAKEAPTRPSVVVIEDLVYMVNDNGVAACLEAKTGKLVWKERLGGSFSASPVYAAGNIYFPAETGTTYVVKAGREFLLVEENELPAGIMASPAVAGNELFLRTKTHLYCIAAK